MLYQGSCTLDVFETVDLGFLSTLQRNNARVADALQSNWPTLVHDPLYNDTIYVYHDFGVHCLLFRPWLEPLARAFQKHSTQLDLEALLDSLPGTDTVCVLDTFSPVDRCAFINSRKA